MATSWLTGLFFSARNQGDILEGSIRPAQGLRLASEKIRMLPSDPLITAKEAAAFLRITNRHLRRLVSQGTVAAYRIGATGKPRFLQDDLKRLLKPAVALSRAPEELRDFITTHIRSG